VFARALLDVSQSSVLTSLVRLDLADNAFTGENLLQLVV
jgi:hypothetical protein